MGAPSASAGRNPGFRVRRALLVALLTGCTPAGDSLDDLFAGRLTVVDLTHPLSADMPFWPNPAGRNPFVHDTIRAQPSGAPAMAAYATPEHHGTHLDAPIHGGDGLPSVDELTAADLFGPVAVIDVTAAAAEDPDYAVTRADIAAWEERHGVIPPGTIVLMASGWSAKWSEGQRYYVGDDGSLHFPGFSADAARFLVDERNVKAIGTDTGSVDPGAADGFPVHGIANGSGIYHLENVARAHMLPPTGAYLIVAPVKIAGGSGGQVRLFAVIPG